MIEKKLADTPVTYWCNSTDSIKTIILLHPEFADHTVYDDQISFLEGKCRVIAPDLIGHGKSLANEGLAKMSQHLAEIMETEKIEKAVVLGFSMGAVIAEDMGNRYPELIEKMCCFSAFDINNFDFRMFQSPDSLMGKIMKISMTPKKKFARSFKEYMAHTEKAQERFYELNLNYDKKNWANFISLGKILNKKPVSERDFPLYIGVGEFEAEDICKANDEWHRREPDSQLIVFKGAGHLANMDTPDEFNDFLLRLMDL